MFKNLIVAAANAYDVYDDKGVFINTVVLVDNCHGGRNMSEVIKTFKLLGCSLKRSNLPEHDGDRQQGFIDECGHYHNRSESYKIAKQSGQWFNDEYTLPKNKLDSSCIRHFEE
jgi:hypothetical protein